MSKEGTKTNIDNMTADGSGYGDPFAKDINDRKFQMLLKAYETAIDTRKLEIQLFWSRSLFFWGIIASVFIAYAALRRFDSDISIVVACFGLVCSVAWSLANRGSKYWQESWEKKVEKTEPSITGKMFSTPEDVQDKGLWLSGRRYSVSKLTIALSDFSVALWVSLIGWEGLRLLSPPSSLPQLKSFAALGFVVFALVYVLLLLWFGQSSTQASKDEAAKSTPTGAFDEHA